MQNFYGDKSGFGRMMRAMGSNREFHLAVFLTSILSWMLLEFYGEREELHQQSLLDNADIVTGKDVSSGTGNLKKNNKRETRCTA